MQDTLHWQCLDICNVNVLCQQQQRQQKQHKISNKRSSYTQSWWCINGTLFYNAYVMMGARECLCGSFYFVSVQISFVSYICHRRPLLVLLNWCASTSSLFSLFPSLLITTKTAVKLETIITVQSAAMCWCMDMYICVRLSTRALRCRSWKLMGTLLNRWNNCLRSKVLKFISFYLYRLLLCRCYCLLLFCFWFFSYPVHYVNNYAITLTSFHVSDTSAWDTLNEQQQQQEKIVDSREAVETNVTQPYWVIHIVGASHLIFVHRIQSHALFMATDDKISGKIEKGTENASSVDSNDATKFLFCDFFSLHCIDVISIGTRPWLVRRQCLCFTRSVEIPFCMQSYTQHPNFIGLSILLMVFTLQLQILFCIQTNCNCLRTRSMFAEDALHLFKFFVRMYQFKK